MSFNERLFSLVAVESDELIEKRLTDVSLDQNGNVTIIDKSRNIVSQYDANGTMLFYWSGRSALGNSLVGLTAHLLQ